MATGNLRRRLHHADVDGRKNEHVDITDVDSLDEPLLGRSSYDNRGSEVNIFLNIISLAIITTYSVNAEY
jgi:hypothetical protein